MHLREKYQIPSNLEHQKELKDFFQSSINPLIDQKSQVKYLMLFDLM